MGRRSCAGVSQRGGYRTMSLHDWSALAGRDGVHQVWIVELLYWIQPRLPAGYRAYIGTTPPFAIGAPPRNGSPAAPAPAAPGEPDDEPDPAIAVTKPSSAPEMFGERKGRVMEAVEVVAIRSKDR